MRIFLTGVVEDGTTRREGVPIDPRASLSVTKGANVEIVVAVVTPGGEPVKLTGVGTELLLTVKKRPIETATISRLAISEGNIGTFTLVPTDTRTQTAGLYGYDVWLTKDGKRDVVVPLSPLNLLEANAAIPADGSLPPVPPSGNLVGGPGSSTDSAVALWNGGDGDLLKNSVIIVDNAGNITVPGAVDGRDVSADGDVLDAHITDLANPHAVAAAQVGSGTAQWNADELQGNAVSTAAPATAEVLTWDGSAWAPATGGGVSGPVSSTDNAIARWDGAGGSALLNSSIRISDAGLLQFGGITSSEPAFRRSGIALEVRKADDSAYGNFIAALIVSTANLQVADEIRLGAGRFIEWNTRSKMWATDNGNIQLTNNAKTDFGLLQFGGVTTAFPAWRRSGTDLDARLANDSAYTGLNVGSLGIRNSNPPATASSAGVAGQIEWDSNFIYVAVAANTWKRAAISTW